jgi:RHS repeat-associated protein
MHTIIRTDDTRRRLVRQRRITFGKETRSLPSTTAARGAILVDYISTSRRLLATVAGGTTSYSLSDRLSARVVLDTNGNVIGRMAHLPFGDDFGESGIQDKHHFTSYGRDTEVGTDYAVNRQYSYNTARFNRIDPVAASAKNDSPQSLNRYEYSENDPINIRDPLGLFGSGWWPEENPCDPLGQTVIVDGIESFGDLFCMEGNAPGGISADPIDPVDYGQFCSVSVRFRPVSHPVANFFGAYHSYILLSGTDMEEVEYLNAFPDGAGFVAAQDNAYAPDTPAIQNVFKKPTTLNITCWLYCGQCE